MDPVIKTCVDRKLPLDQLPDLADQATQERPANAPMQRVDGVPPDQQRVRMAILTGKAWRTGRTLRVCFLDGRAGVRTRVRDVAVEWMDHANVRFEFSDDPDSEIRISFKQAGSWSRVGTEALAVAKGKPTMNLGWLREDTPAKEYSKVVLHEFGHALACLHEHQNPSAGIPWNKEAVYRYYTRPPNRWTKSEVDLNIFDEYGRDVTQFTTFDPKSIMIYPIPKELTLGGFHVKWNLCLSDTDKDFIAARYPFKDELILELQMDAPPIEGAIGRPADENHYQFELRTPEQIVLETFGSSNVVMALFGPDSKTERIAWDDDSGLGQNAKIETVLMEGSYFVRIQHKRPTGTGKYSLSLSRLD